MGNHEGLARIEKLAYQLWEKEGRPQGEALTYWLKAEKLLSDDAAFLERELEVEEEEGGIVPKPDSPQQGNA